MEYEKFQREREREKDLGRDWWGRKKGRDNQTQTLDHIKTIEIQNDQYSV